MKRPLMVISGFVHDVSSFVYEHPDGEAYLRAYTAKDATSAFHGGSYDHSDAAVNLLATLRVAILRHGVEVVSTGDPPDPPLTDGGDDWAHHVPPCRKLRIVEARMRDVA